MNRKRNFTDCELETLLTEVEARRRVLLGTLSSGITRSRKTSEWESVCRAVNAAGSEQRTVPQVKKKWSDMKVQVKRKVAALRPGVALTPCDERLAALVGVTAVTGVVGAHVGDSEFFQDCATDTWPGTSRTPGGSGVTTAPPSSSVTRPCSYGSSSSGASSCSSGDVGAPITPVLQQQDDIVRGIEGIYQRLDRLIDVLISMSDAIKELVRE